MLITWGGIPTVSGYPTVAVVNSQFWHGHISYYYESAGVIFLYKTSLEISLAMVMNVVIGISLSQHTKRAVSLRDISTADHLRSVHSVHSVNLVVGTQLAVFRYLK